MKNVLYYFTQKHKGNWEEIYNSLSIKEIIPKDKYLKINMNDISNYTCIVDKNYPSELKTIYKPPFSIFMYGNKELLNKKLLGIYGTNISITYVKKLNEFNKIVFVLDFDNKKLINFFIKNNINFILVSKNGIKNLDKKLFDNVIENGNLILTEMPNENEEIYNDQLHNRIIFGLTKKMLFLNSKIDNMFYTIIEFCKLENVSCFSFSKFNNKYIKQVDGINQIFINYFMN